MCAEVMPWSAAAKVVDRFKLLGRAMAKALQDNRLLDIPLSYVFYRSAHSTLVCDEKLARNHISSPVAPVKQTRQNS